MEQKKLFELPEETAITADTVLAAGRTCRECEHRQRWLCNSKVFQYCGKRKSNRTSNGQLKIKCKDKACALFEQVNNNCIKSDVSNRRELLISFLQWFFNNETNIEGDPETKDFVDIYLKTNL